MPSAWAMVMPYPGATYLHTPMPLDAALVYLATGETVPAADPALWTLAGYTSPAHVPTVVLWPDGMRLDLLPAFAEVTATRIYAADPVRVGIALNSKPTPEQQAAGPEAPANDPGTPPGLPGAPYIRSIAAIAHMVAHAQAGASSLVLMQDFARLLQQFGAELADDVQQAIEYAERQR